MILVDTSALLALLEPRDGLHAQAHGDLDRLPRGPLVICLPVLTEAFYFLGRTHRARLERMLGDLGVQPYVADDEAALWREAFDWLARYAGHEPDFTAGYLAAISARELRSRVWTYDSEFRTIWRRLDGSRIPLAGRMPT